MKPCPRYTWSESIVRARKASSFKSINSSFSSALPYLLREEYKQLFSVFLGKPILADAGLVNANTVQILLAEHLGQKADHGNRLWLLLNAEVWYRMLIEGQSRDNIVETLEKGAAVGL